MKRLIGYAAAICLLALTAGCGGVTSTGTLAYISNSAGTGFTVYNVNSNGTLTLSDISPVNAPVGPKVLQFSANGKWAYYMDSGGTQIYGYTRAANGQLATPVGPPQPVGPAASSLVISPNSQFLYVALPNTGSSSLLGQLAVFQIDQSTGILTQVQTNLSLGYRITQLVISSNGTALYGLAPAQQSVVTFSLNTSSGVATLVNPYSVGSNPANDAMILSPNGDYMYIPDQSDTTPIVVNGVTVNSPDIYAYTVTGTTLTKMPTQNSGAIGIFNENPSCPQLQGQTPTTCTPVATTQPVAGVITTDNRFLFIANQGSANISVFRINTTNGQLTEVTGVTTLVNGVSVSTSSPFDCGTGCGTPSFLALANSNNALYVLDTTAGKVFQFAVDVNSGAPRALSPTSQGAESATSKPTWITIR